MTLHHAAATGEPTSPLAGAARLSDLIQVGADALLRAIADGWTHKLYPTCVNVRRYPDRVSVEVDVAGAVLCAHHDILATGDDGEYLHLEEVPLRRGDGRAPGYRLYSTTPHQAFRQMVITHRERERLTVLESLVNSHLGDCIHLFDPPSWLEAHGPRCEEVRRRRELAANAVRIPLLMGEDLVRHLSRNVIPELREAML